MPSNVSHMRSFNDSFLKYSQFFVHVPDSIIRAGQLGAITAPYPASPPPEPGRSRSRIGGGGHRPCRAKQHVTYEVVQCFISIILTVLCACAGPCHQGWAARCCNCAIPGIPSPPPSECGRPRSGMGAVGPVPSNKTSWAFNVPFREY